MSCSNKKYTALMNKVLDDEATAEEKSELYAHLAVCDSCRVHFEELKQSTELLHQLVHPSLPAGFTEHVLAQLPADERHAIRKWTSRHPFLSAAALCALPVSLLVIAAGRQGGVQKTGDQFVLLKDSGSQS